MLGYNNDTDFSPEQKQWISDPSKCPACGENITKNDIMCKSCGLKIKQNRFTKPLDLQPKTNVGGIKYHYKGKEEK